MPYVTILQVVPRLDAGGSEQAAVEIAQALARAGASALVATEGGRMATAVTAGGGEIVPLPVASKNPITILANARGLARLIEERGVNLIHARSRAPAWSAFLAARRTGRPFVTTYHGAYGNPGPLKGAYNSVMGRGDRVIANSLYTAKLIASRHENACEHIRTIYRGVDESMFNPDAVAPASVAKLRERWGLAPETKIVLQAARLTGLKGHRHTIEAASLLNQQGALEGAAIIFAGDAAAKSGHREELAALIARHGLERKVLLVGHCQEMPAAFLAAQVALMPSLVPETFGRTSIEAQAMGSPVILSDLGALPETIVSPEQDRAQFTGWLVPPGDAAALAARIKFALDLPPEGRAALGARARQRVVAKFTLRRMQRDTLSVYDELLGTSLADRFDERPTGSRRRKENFTRL
jgi:glycosyltransferase involved in cell wall biosynthesis